MLVCCQETNWNSYLSDIVQQEENIFFRLVKQFVEESITEKFKANNQMALVGQINNIYNRTTEIVNTDLIYT